MSLIVVVWLHLCIGIHFWLRLKSGYPRFQQYLLATAVLVPALAIAGFVSAGINVMLPPPQPIPREDLALLLNRRHAPPDGIVSAIGDTINSAARLESLTKQYGCTLIVSLDTLRFAGIAPPETGWNASRCAAGTEQLEVLPVEDPASLLLPIDP